jgi:hypothetical protein
VSVDRLHALAFNELTTVLSMFSRFVPLSEREEITRRLVAVVRLEADAEPATAVEQAREVYRKFFTDAQVGRDGYRQFIGKLQAELFEALHGMPRSSSIWLDQISREQHEAENPHHPCGKEQAHEGHVWRGSRGEFGGACEVIRTYWCEGIVSDQEAL